MKRPSLILNKDCGQAVLWVSNHLRESGLQVVQTFDLNTARIDHSLCSCPYHGTEQCDCQMVVLLVYEHGFSPASVVAHGHDGQTWFMLVESPQQETHTGLETVIQDALAPHIFSQKLEDLANAS